eukprot:1650919-Rhodomonas_salina.1
MGIGATELGACVACPAESTTDGMAGQVSLDACACKPGYYSYRTDTLVCHQCPDGAECPDGTSFVTRSGLDATGQVIWVDDPLTGRKWLRACPQVLTHAHPADDASGSEE